MASHNEKITLRQLQLLIILGAMGTGLIVLPRRVAQFAGRDGWLIVLGLTALAMVLAALLVAAARVKPGAAFMEYAGYALSRPVAYVIGALLWAKLVLSAGLELRAFLVITQQVLLRETPIFVVSVVMLFVCTYAAAKGIEARARVAEVLVLVMILPLLFLFALALLNINVSNLQPVFTTPPERLLTGTWRLGFIFTGLECLLLASPYIAREKKMGRAAVGAVGLAGLIITAITVITLAKFGSGVVDEPWPVLRMMDMLNLPGSFIERQEALMFSFWIVTVFALVNALIFFGGVLVADMWRGKKVARKGRPPVWAVMFTAAIVFAVTCMPWEGEGIYRRLDWLFYTGGAFFLLVFPILVLLGAGVRKKISAWRNTSVLILLAIPLMTFTGCYDRVEIEDRAFVVAMGLEKAEDSDERYTLTISTTSAENAEEGENEKQIKTASAQTLTEAMHKLDTEANQRFYYGQAKLLVLSESLLSEASLVKKALAALVQNPEIDRQIQIIATPDNIKEAIQTETYNKANAINFSLNLEDLNTKLQRNGCALIPAYPHGAVALKHFEKALNLDPEALRGFLWCFPQKNKNAVITITHDGEPIPFSLEKHTVEITFAHACPTPKITIHVLAEGRMNESFSLPPETVKLLIANKITGEIRATAEKLQAKNLDVYHWQEHLQKKQYKLYRQFGHPWVETFPKLQIVPIVSVNIKA